MLEGGKFFENIAAFLKKEKPDIAVFQEVHDGKDPSLPKNLQSMQMLQALFPGYQYYFSATHKDILPEGEFENGNAVFSRFPITKTETTFYNAPYDPHYIYEDRKGDFSNDPCNIQHVTVSIENKPFHIFNTHGIWGFEGNDNPRRFRMSEVIISEIKGKSPAVLAGDFNTQPSAKAIKNIEQHMTNVFKDELVSTFNMRHKTLPGYATAVVDYIFVSPDISVRTKSCPEDDVSDHKPLIVTIEF